MLYNCYKCKFNTYTKSRIENHIKLHNSNGKVFECDICGFLVSTSHHLKRHMNIHEKSKNYNCGKCSYSNKNLNLIKKHFTESHFDLFSCESCEEVYLCSGELEKHKKESHSSIKKDREDKPLIEMELKPPSIPKENLGLPIELDQGSGSSKGEIDQGSGSSKGEIDQGSGSSKTYPCSKCDFSTYSRCSYYRHVKNHDKTKRFFCDLCDFGTHSRGCLHYHRRKHFKGEFKCKKCKKFYTRGIDLKYHNDKNHPTRRIKKFDYLDISKDPVFYSDL
jgi:KRAB domain-containing zinc finger protein